MSILAEQDIVLTEDDFCQISDIVHSHCGINLHTGKKELVRARLAKRLRLGKFHSFQEYMQYVLEDKTGKEFSILIDSLSTNLTSFFREQKHFQFLVEKYLPELVKLKQKKRDYKIRIWSAGCSSGEEPYSIAITLRECLEGLGRWDVKILGTDISTRMLEAAQKGIYTEKIIQSVPALLKSKYLLSKHRNGPAEFEVSQSLRDIVVFRYLNLMEDWPIKGPLDCIFCRNVMIYFDKPTQQRLINRFWDLLAPGAVLFTGHSESLTGIEHKYHYVQPTIYRKL